MHVLPRIAIIYLSYHSEPYLDRFVSAVKKLTYPKDKLALVIVDNPHPVHGSGELTLRDKIESLGDCRKRVPIVPHPAPLLLEGEGIDCPLPYTVLLPQQTNLGFAGGNNVGIKWALEHGYDYVYLHNQDGFLEPDALEPLVSVMESDKNIAVAQSLLLLYPETHLLNNAGNSFHYLGFGFCSEYRKPFTDYMTSIGNEGGSAFGVLIPSPPAPSPKGRGGIELASVNPKLVLDIPYASGAACMVRADAIRKYGLLDEDFFMYHEDLEWCFRFKMVGMRTVLVPDSRFYHEYQFSRSMEKYYYMERNRFGILLMFYKLPTLILLMPMFFIMEIGLWFFAWRGGWVDKRRAVYQYWLKRENVRLWLAKRKRIQKIRTISDRDILKISSPGIYFQEKEVEHPLLVYIANPVMWGYYWMLRAVVWW